MKAQVLHLASLEAVQFLCLLEGHGCSHILGRRQGRSDGAKPIHKATFLVNGQKWGQSLVGLAPALNGSGKICHLLSRICHVIGKEKVATGNKCLLRHLLPL